MFKTNRTPWKMHLLPSDLADRFFRVFCRRVILGGWQVGGGGGPPRKKKKSCSEFAETCSRFGIFEIWQKKFFGGG